MRSTIFGWCVGIAIVALVIGIPIYNAVHADDSPKPKQAVTFDEAAIGGEVKQMPDGTAYLVAMDGVWQLKGTEAVKVKEVPQFTQR